MAIVEEHTLTTFGTSTDPSITFNWAPTSGNFLIASLQCGASTVNTPPSGWTAFPLATAQTNITAIYYKVATGSENATSVTWAVDENTYYGASLFEYSGIAASPEDQTASNAAASAESVTITASAQNAQAVSLVFVSVLVYDDNMNAPTGYTGYTLEHTTTEANWQNSLVFTKITSALETPSITVNVDNSGTGMEMQGCLAVFKGDIAVNDYGVIIDLDQREFVKTVNPA